MSDQHAQPGRERDILVWGQVGPSWVGLPIASLGLRSILLYSARPSFRMLIPDFQNKLREFMMARSALQLLFKGMSYPEVETRWLMLKNI